MSNQPKQLALTVITLPGMPTHRVTLESMQTADGSTIWSVVHNIAFKPYNLESRTSYSAARRCYCETIDKLLTDAG